MSTSRPHSPLTDSPPEAPPSPPVGRKSKIAIVGAGSAGIGTLLGLLDLPSNIRDRFDITLYEKRDGVGGLWLPDPSPASPPSLPETPLYPLLKTNTPVPTMTFPNIPFAPNTPLYPLHQHIETYHREVVATRNLAKHLQLSSEVASAEWNPRTQVWDLVIRAGDISRREEAEYFIIANGHYRYPAVPAWEGTDEWLAAEHPGSRELKHSLWYRGSESLQGRTVVVVGFGASGWDLARQALPFATEVYHSFDPPPAGSPRLPPIPGSVTKPRVSHFTSSGVHFVDGTSLSASKVTIYLATGYQVLAPFLSADLAVAPHKASSPITKLTTNGKYIRPLHLDLFSAGDPDMPVGRLAFVGLGYFVAAASASYAQGLFFGHAISQQGFLPEREEVLQEVVEREAAVRAAGFEPHQIGHKFTAPGDAEAYQNHLVALIRAKSQLPLPAFLRTPDRETFVEPWRLAWRAKGIKLGLTWLKALEKGVAGEARFTSQTGTEADWVRAMETLEAWGEEQEVKDAAAVVGVEFA